MEGVMLEVTLALLCYNECFRTKERKSNCRKGMNPDPFRDIGKSWLSTLGNKATLII